MAEFTPTIDEVRFRYAEFPYVSQIEDEPGDPAEFDRWLSAHDAATRTAALEEAAVIAMRMFFGGDRIGRLHSWGAQQAALAIRSAKAGES